MEPATFTLIENSRDKLVWTLALHEDRLTLTSPDGAVRALAPADAKVRINLDGLLAGWVWATFERRITFRRDPASANAILAWFGPPTTADLGAVAMRRYSLANLITSVAILITATPWVAPGWLQTSLGGEPGFDPLLITWGGGMLLICAVARLRPHRLLFLGEAAIAVTTTVWWVGTVAFGDRSPWWLLIAPVGLLGAVSAMRAYRRFATMA